MGPAILWRPSWSTVTLLVMLLSVADWPSHRCTWRHRQARIVPRSVIIKVLGRAGHFRDFLIFSIIKNDLLHFYQINNLFLHHSYLKSQSPVKLTWWKMQKIFYYYQTPKVPSSGQIIFKTRGGPFRYFLFFSIIKKYFLHILSS